MIDALRSLAGLALCLLVAGCDASSTRSVQPEALAPSAAPAPTAQSFVPRLQAGDKVRVTVFGEDRLSGDYEVDAGGSLSLPLAGTIAAAGLTKAELERELTKKFRGQYLKDPKVTVDISGLRPYYVLGEVQKPGEYTFKNGLNVMSAIAVAGGQTYRASGSYVLIQRAGETGLKEYPLSPATPVFPGDLIRVPERYF